MKVLVTGVKGQLGYDCVNELVGRGHEAIGVDVEEMDITDAEAVENFLQDVKPEAVIHCAAWTAVDAAEDEENKEKVNLVNAVGSENIARTCKKLGCKMMYISTDYIFHGEGEKPWQEECEDYAPLNVYGESKLKGELAVKSNLSDYFIVRIAWVFGKNGNNFIKTMLNVGKRFPELKVVNDQIGTPTYTYDLARLLVDMIETDKYGTYHATNEGGYISWYDFTKEIFRQAVAQGHEMYQEDVVKVTPVTTAEYGVSKAARPYNSRLAKGKLASNGFTPLPTWQDAVGRYLQEIEF